jgi:hypothetical protein
MGIFYIQMDYESSPEPLPTNHTKPNAGKRLSPEKIKQVEDLLKAGHGVNSVQEQTKVSNNSIIGIKQRLDQQSGFESGTWKKNTARLMQQIVTRGSERLMTEIDNIPAGQLPLAIAIMTDKALILQDAPSVVVEHRLKVSHHDINAMLRGEIIDVTPKQNSVDSGITEC